MSRRVLLILVSVLAAVPLLLATAGDGVWMTKVPEKNRQRQNPFDSVSNAVAAGAKLFRQNCALWHAILQAAIVQQPFQLSRSCIADAV